MDTKEEPVQKDNEDILNAPVDMPIDEPEEIMDKPKKNKQNTFKERLDKNDKFKQERLDYLSEMIRCKDCGAEITRSSMSYHRRSRKHLMAESTNNNTVLIENISRLLRILESNSKKK